MDSVKIKTYAKINLSLDILGKRPDNYHEVRMIMHQIDLFDVLTVTVATPGEYAPGQAGAGAGTGAPDPEQPKAGAGAPDPGQPKAGTRASDPEQPEAGAGAGATAPGQPETGAGAGATAPEQPKAGAGATDPGQPEAGTGASAPGQPETGKVRLSCSNELVPDGKENIAVKAAIKMLDLYGSKTDNNCIYINIEKNIPVAAGLAGGSSNAAGVLLALNKLWDLHLSLDELMKIGTSLGADVPFCIMGQAALNKHIGTDGGSVCALAEGIGEVLTPLPGIDACVLLSKPPIEVSTAEVYKAFDEVSDYNHPDTEALIQCIKEGSIKKINKIMANVLEKITLTKYPYVRITHSLMSNREELTARMSGSGPTIFSLFESFEQGKMLFEEMKAQNRETFFIKTCK